MHAVGQSYLQHLRLAAALLPAARRLRQDIPRADGRDRLVELRPQERQPALPGLHGALRVRAERRPRRVQFTARDGSYLGRHGDGPDMRDPRLADLVERAFDYRGYVTLRRNDGSELVGFIYDRGASHLELFDETATRRVRVALADITAIDFTGEEAALKSQEMWERRRCKREARETPMHGGWEESRPILIVVALDRELRSVARAFGLARRGTRARGRLGGSDLIALGLGLGGGARRAVAEERPRLVFSCGFSGGLDPALAPGDLVLATTVRDENGDEFVPAGPLRTAAAHALRGLRCAQGGIICTT